MIEVLKRDDMEQFEREGGEKGMLVAAVMHALTWLSIGALFHLGWRIVG